MANDYRNSTAQLAIEFLTSISITTNPGDNYMRTAVFIDRLPEYVADDSGFLPLFKNEDGSIRNDYIILTKNNYAEIVGGRLLTWLTDLFCNQQPYQVYLVRFGPAGGIGSSASYTEDVSQELKECFNRIKYLCYFQTVLAVDVSDNNLITAVALDFAKLCMTDTFLASCPFYPHRPDTVGIPSTDPLWNALKAAGAPAFMSYHGDPERNGALFSLGLCLAIVNNSGTPVGNSIDMIAGNLITPSGQPDPSDPDFEYNDLEDYNLTSTQQTVLENTFIQFFRTTGDGTAQVEGIGEQDTNGGYLLAKWMVNFINFVNKVKVATRITKRNVFRNSMVYGDILSIMTGTVGRFGGGGSGRLDNIKITAPSFDNLPPSSGKSIVIPNAWSADMLLNLKTISVSGELNISA